MSKLNLVIIALGTLFLMGCGQKLPDGMPKLYPTLITITQEGKPVADANVKLMKKDELTYKWLAGGRTDELGVCKVKTQGKYDGAPAGDFSVVVYKTVVNESATRKSTPTPSDPAEAAEWSRKVAEEEASRDVIDTKYKKIQTTDLTISIQEGKNEESFDVGPEVDIEFVPTAK